MRRAANRSTLELCTVHNSRNSKQFRARAQIKWLKVLMCYVSIMAFLVPTPEYSTLLYRIYSTSIEGEQPRGLHRLFLKIGPANILI